MIDGSQCRAARALVQITREKLASLSGVNSDIIEQFERRLAKPSNEQIAQLRAALERLGAQFIDENGGGVGVRLKFSRSETKRIADLENEGGISGFDDVP